MLFEYNIHFIQRFVKQMHPLITAMYPGKHHRAIATPVFPRIPFNKKIRNISGEYEVGARFNSRPWIM